MRLHKTSLNLFTVFVLALLGGGALAQTASPADPSGTIRDAAAAVRSPGASSPLLAFCVDQDTDGWFVESNPGACPPMTQVGDCADNNPAIHPGAMEVCNDVDDDCDGMTDEGLRTTYYPDQDMDGFGDPASPLNTCTNPQPSGFVLDNTDCDDTNGNVNPVAPEVCNGIDDNCANGIDEGPPSCSDGNQCTFNDTCVSGTCVGTSTVVVRPGAMNGWFFFDDNTGPPGTGTIVAGPAMPPLGTGSARLALNATATDRQNLSTFAYAGTRFDQITALQYSTYRSSVDAGNNLAISLQFDTDYDLTDMNTAFQGRLVFEPYQGLGGNVPQNTWQTWSPMAGRWWASGAPGNGVCPQATPCTWMQVLTAFPNAGLRASIGLLHFRAGAPWPNFDGNVDALTIGVSGSNTTFDFDPAGPPCNDGQFCTVGESCSGGMCAGGTPNTCDDMNQCTLDSCDEMNDACVNAAEPNDTPCNDGNGCTQTDRCQMGMCTGTNPVVCMASDQCHQVGTCNPMTGMCSNPEQPNGFPCSDNNACTQTDTCQMGMCAGTNPVVCMAQDQCHQIGTCDPMSGLCSNPTVPDGSACTDGDACTIADSCQGGSCVNPAAVVWNVPGDNSNTCTTGNPSCSTIQGAINAASHGDTILVAAGIYPESLTVGKGVKIRGAQAGVNACSRMASESIVSGTGIGTVRVNLTTAACAIIDGFTVTGGGSTTNGAIASTVGPLDRTQLLNNRVIAWTGDGVFLNRGGVNISVRGNLIDATLKSGSGNGLFLNGPQTFAGLQVTDNCLTYGGAPGTFAPGTGLFVDGNHNWNPSTGADGRPPVLDGNRVDRQATGVNLGSRSFTGSMASAGVIANNRITNSQFDGIQGGIQLSSINANVFNRNGRSGLALTSFGNTGADRGGQNSTITNNCFTNNGLGSNSFGVLLRNAGLLYSSSQGMGLISTNAAHGNSFNGNHRGAIYGNTCSTIGSACLIDADCTRVCASGSQVGKACMIDADCAGGGTCPAPTCVTAASGGTETINNETNFWGHPSGPNSPPQNPMGTGDRVDTPNNLGGTIDLIPFSTTTSLMCPCTQASCDDGNPCTIDLCNPATDQCEYTPNACDDGDACTTDTCSTMSGCQHAPSCVISGTIRYYRDNIGPVEPSTKPVEGEIVDYSSNVAPMAQSDTTDAMGFYQFPMAGHGNVTVTPRDLQTISDPECNNAINSSDASRASQIAVAIPPAPTPNQRVAGDVSNNGSITAFDASLIAQKSTAPSCTGFVFPVETATGSDWAWAPASRSHMPLMSNATDDFLGILYGDITGNWIPLPPIAPASSGTRGGRIEGEALTPLSGAPGASGSPEAQGRLVQVNKVAAPDVVLPSQFATIYLARAPKSLGNDLWEYTLGVHDADGIFALDLAFHGTVENAVVKSVAVTGLSASFQAASNPVGNELLVALYGISPMLGSGEFLIVTVQQQGPSSGVTFEVSGQANEGLIPLGWEPDLSGEPSARPASGAPSR